MARNHHLPRGRERREGGGRLLSKLVQPGQESTIRANKVVLISRRDKAEKRRKNVLHGIYVANNNRKKKA